METFADLPVNCLKHTERRESLEVLYAFFEYFLKHGGG